MSLEQDYPSFGQIRDQLSDKNMAVVFGVVVNDNPSEVPMTQLYRDVSNFIQVRRTGQSRDPSRRQTLEVMHGMKSTSLHKRPTVGLIFNGCGVYCRAM